MVQRLRRWLLPAIVCVGTIGCGGNGTDTSSPSSPQAPTITAQPQDLGVTTGTAASFNVTATGDATLAYQWRRNGSAIAGATAAAYSLAAAAKTDDGAEFSVVVTNSAGSATSRAAKLTVTDPAAAITTSPQSASTTAGQTAIFSVVATGTGTLSYQWLRDGADIAGATAASYTTAALTLADNGAKFSVRVTDANASSATSAEAVLTVTAAATSTSTMKLYQGDGYTLALRQDGKVLMLGSEASLDRAPATPVAGTDARLIDGLTAVDISASLAVSADGRLWRWGAFGGDSTTAPRVIAGIDQVNSALTVVGYTLALRNDGTVWHFPGVESVTSGGASTVTPRSMAGLSGVARLALGLTGGSMPLAIKSDGTVWQMSWTAQVTMGPSGPVTTHTGSARQVAGLADVADIACATSSHCLARRRDGSVIAWGLNDEGQLGSSTGGSAVAVEAAIAVPGLGRVVALGAMSRSSAAITQDGRLWTWGAWHGQGNASSFYAPTAMPRLDGAVALSCGTGCAVLLGDGSLWGWGGSGVFTGTAPSQAAGLTIDTSGVTVTRLPQAVQTHVGQAATFSVEASSRSGAVPSYQWLRDGVEMAGARSASLTTPALTLADDGARYSVRIGDASGSLTTRGAELLVTATPTSSTAPGRVMTDRLYLYSDAAGSAATWRWGDGSADSSGSPVSKVWRAPGDYSAQRNGSPMRVVAIGHALADGYDHSCALKADGTVVCWGSNSYGQLGDGTVVDRRVPVAVPGLSAVVSLSAGSQTTCALKSDRSVWCWGRNELGQLGNGTRIDSRTPTQVSGLIDATAVAAGSFHTCALRSGGGVRCWGSNSSGALGTATTANPSSTPVDVAGLSDAVALDSGSGSCAVRRSGQVACWGTQGLVARPSGTPVYQATTVTGLDNIVSVRFGPSHMCALRGDQRVLCWGNNLNGQLGDGSSTTRSSPTLVTGLSDAVAISLGDSHSCALRAGGGVACWGYAGAGAIGAFPPSQSVPVNVLTPRDIPDLSGVTAVQSQREHSCALTGQGRMLCWGEGILGSGSVARNYTPVPVFGGAVYWK
jgi:alpha-tubulin suppressor-like RCC1 family protein